MDYNDEELGLPFTIPDLYGPSRWLLDVQDSSGSLFSDLKLDGTDIPKYKITSAYCILDLDQKLPEVVDQFKKDENFFRIPDFQIGPSQHVPELIPTPNQEIAIATPPERDDDIWLMPEVKSIKSAYYQSWDSFDDAKNHNPSTSYITEAGPLVFEAAIGESRDFLRIGNANYPVVVAAEFASSLLALGLGRSSVLFAWDDEKFSFRPTLSRMRIPGYTAESLDGLLSMFLNCGNATKFLHEFIDKAYTKRKSPGQIALAEAVSTLLSTIQSCLSQSASQLQSILQLQLLFQPAHSILFCFECIVKNIAQTRSDESMLSTIFAEIQRQEHRTDSLKVILIEVLSKVSYPWLEFVSEWLGLRREAGLLISKEGQGRSFVAITDKEWVDEQGIELQEKDYVLNYDKVPSFIAPEDARAMFEVGKSLRFLQAHHTDHPLTRAEVVASANPPSLEWKFSWQDIVAVESKALKYEKELIEIIRLFSKDASSLENLETGCSARDPEFQLDFFGKPEKDMQARMLASIDTFNLPLVHEPAPDQFSVVLQKFLTTSFDSNTDMDSMFSPPISLAPLFSFNPLISAQARIVNGTCMRMFFKSHHLRQHLSLQRSFHLLGNGLFSSRLSHALFDPDLESAERHRGVARSGGVMGLRLGGRDTWPPASSELRLALMGVLTECYTSNESLDQAQTGTFLEKTLPGDLSFAVRDMSEEEIARCMNADSIEALDFLRLSYKPPPPLEAVITPIILFKYDQLFKLLLRVIRMLYVVSTLFKDARDRNSARQKIYPVTQRFRIEAQHFVTCISSYFFDTGIECTWRIFDRKLDEIEARINSDSDNITLGQNEGLDKLRDYHEHVLDRIMFALLLRKRQQPVMHLLEEIFTLILRFSRLFKESSSRALEATNTDSEIEEIYKKFAKKVGVFITVCRGLSEKKGYGDKKNMDGEASHGGLFGGDDLADENTIAHLLSRLEMSNYYSKSAKAQ